MRRTQIYLPEEMHEQLGLLAKKTNLSMGEIIRKLIKEGITKQKIFFGKNDLLSLANLKIKGGPKNISKNFDFYLYR